MIPTHSQTQFYDSGNLQPNVTYNPQDNNHNNHAIFQSYSGQISTAGVYHVTSAPQTIHHAQSPSFQLPQQANPQNQIQPVYHPTVFYYRPPNDFYHFHVNCKEISYAVSYLLNNSLNGKRNNIQFNENEHIFFYQQQYNNRFYQVTCEIVSPASINYYLNKNVHGNEIDQNMEQERLEFTYERKENIEFYVTQYLSQYLLN